MYSNFRCGHSKKPSNRTPTHQLRGCGYQCKLCRFQNKKRRRDLGRQKSIAPLLKQQRNRCAICRRAMLRPNQDHNHKHCKSKKNESTSGCVKCRRGLLCGSCNGGLHLIENEKLHQAAIAYLNKWT